MGECETPFDFLYRMLEVEIKTGHLVYGDVLPSIQQLSMKHNVGIRTVRDVLLKLKVDGLVRSQESIGYSVSFRSDGEIERQLLTKWDAVIDATKLMVYVMPDIIQLAAQISNPDTTEQLKQEFLGGADRKKIDWYRQGVDFCASLLSVYHNEYLVDLFRHLSRFFEVPALNGDAQTNAQIAQVMQKGIIQLIAQIESHEFSRMTHVIKSMYSDIGFLLNQYFLELKKRHPQHKDYSSAAFEWNMGRGRHQYITLARSLLRDIGVGVYPRETVLPPVSDLSRTSALSRETVIQALSLLQETGLVTQKFHGAVVTPGGAIAADPNNWSAPLTQELHTYLCSLQLLMIFSRNISSLYYDESTVAEMWVNQLLHTSCSIHSILANMIACQPIRSLRHICDQLMEAMVWDFYMQHIYKHQWAASSISFADLCRQYGMGKFDQFFEVIQKSYRNHYSLVQEALLKWKNHEAELRLLPQ